MELRPAAPRDEDNVQLVQVAGDYRASRYERQLSFRVEEKATARSEQGSVDIAVDYLRIRDQIANALDYRLDAFR